MEPVEYEDPMMDGEPVGEDPMADPSDDGDPMRKLPDLSHFRYFFLDDDDRRDMDKWMAYGKCYRRSELLDMFNPPVADETGNPDRKARILTGMAKKFCNGVDDGMVCSMRDTCLTYALDQKIHFGVWGGLTVRERRREAGLRSNK